MRSAGRRVVNGAFCLPEFGRGRARGGGWGRRGRGGAGRAASEVGGERKWRRRRRRLGAANADPRGR